MDARGSAPDSTPLVSEIGHYLFSGQSVSFPNDFEVIPGSEVGENINSIISALSRLTGCREASKLVLSHRFFIVAPGVSRGLQLTALLG